MNIKKVILTTCVLCFGASGALAATANVSFTNTGTTVGGTSIFRADLSGTGLTQVGSVKITDQSGGTGGASGIFSGFDIDAVFLDVDGSLVTTADQYFGSSFAFQAGTVRATSDPSLMPNVSHPGPLFGSLSANQIDLATATLSAFDAISAASVDIADGFLSLGDGGVLTVNFSPTVPLVGTLFLMAGEVGGNGEALEASVEISQDPSVIPLPAGAWLLIGGLGGLAAFRRRKFS